MSKARIEALSDGVFAIVMTLLIFDIKVPLLTHPGNGHELLRELSKLGTFFCSYFVSFAILGMYWISHHALFHLFAKRSSSGVAIVNILFLCLIALIPFSAHLIGRYSHNIVAVAIYGANIIVIGLVQYIILVMVVRDANVVYKSVTERLIMHTSLRMLMPSVFAIFGVLMGFVNVSVSYVLFAFPIIFNIIPATMVGIERAIWKEV